MFFDFSDEKCYLLDDVHDQNHINVENPMNIGGILDYLTSLVGRGSEFILPESGFLPVSCQIKR